jgi:hypothetical protein
MDEALDLFAAQYQAADEAYQSRVDINRKINMTSGRSTLADIAAEEHALERLMAAHRALAAAVERAYPTVR